MHQKPNFQRLLLVIIFNTVIALGISVFTSHGLWVNWVHSQCIGMSIWALTDFGQFWLIPDIEHQWRRLFLLVPVSVTLGYVVGSAMARALLPVGSLGVGGKPAELELGFLFVSLIAGGVITYYFMSREQLARARADIARSQRQAAEAQLMLLQAQLEPHMLFNTLANLRALIALDPPQAQAMLDRMVAYLRATLNSSRVTAHPLQAEFDRLRDYLELMAVRMGPRLHYVLDLPPELAAQPVPPLLLQPLVENAIKHGLEPKVEGGRISVRATRTQDHITLEVEDTGVGLSADPTPPDGFGLAQVRERLATTYGAKGTIELIAANQGNTRARVTFPLEKHA
ncbi:histidine kinase [Rhodoferax sp.]|uniref:sensor histidine kinase n=1 Tax=Rhodoferax sp. TaxID=50421 RepID=UPI0026027F59|nr:histidine kinase [Rhodoferax sp.]MDD2926694.1 histidine kinase [Rhodoferax sp.]